LVGSMTCPALTRRPSVVRSSVFKVMVVLTALGGAAGRPRLRIFIAITPFQSSGVIVLFW
jgi:hypothetical protein